MKTKDIIEFAQAINAVLRSTTPRPMAFGFKLALNAKAIAPITEAYDAERMAAIKALATLDDNGNMIMDADGNVNLGAKAEAFNVAMRELGDVDVSVKLATISIDKCPAELEPAIVLGLLPMLTDTTDVPAVANANEKAA